MSELTKIDASPKEKGAQRDLRADMPQNVEEFDVLLVRYKQQSPEKYKKKLENGDLIRQAKFLGFVWPTKGESSPLPASPETSPVNATDGAVELAEEHDLDLSLIQGTGSKGRIVKDDVEEVLELKKEQEELKKSKEKS